jgi:hypothetical protein
MRRETPYKRCSSQEHKAYLYINTNSSKPQRMSMIVAMNAFRHKPLRRREPQLDLTFALLAATVPAAGRSIHQERKPKGSPGAPKRCSSTTWKPMRL